MNKNEWFKSLQKNLDGLPFDEEQRAIDYYRELYADKIEGGASEKEILQSFGSPESAAQEILHGGENSKAEAPMPEITEKEDNILRIVKNILSLLWTVFLDLIVGSIFFGLIGGAIKSLVTSIVTLSFGGILMSLGGLLISTSLGVIAMTPLVKKTIEKLKKIFKE